MAQPPITRKPIPHTIDAWRKEVAGLRAQLEGMEKMRKNNGTAWVQGMRRHVRARIEDLLDNAPTTLVKSGEARKARRG